MSSRWIACCRLAVAFAAASLAVTAAAVAQSQPQTPSLADLARQEQARRGSHHKGTKVYTNGDLKSVRGPQDDTPADPGSLVPSASSGAPDASGATPATSRAASGTADTASAGKAQADKAPADSAQGEQYWHDRMSQAREDVRRNQMFLDALQSRINALGADFAGRDDPYQRAQIADDRQKALAELDRVKAEIQRATKQIGDLEEEARRAGVPPGWLR